LINDKIAELHFENTDALYKDNICCHNEIYYEKTSLYQHFTFDLGFGHGIMRCPFHYKWKFEIDNECTLNLIESLHIVTDPGYPAI
jgi:hypothetical protein